MATKTGFTVVISQNMCYLVISQITKLVVSQNRITNHKTGFVISLNRIIDITNHINDISNSYAHFDKTILSDITKSLL